MGGTCGRRLAQQQDQTPAEQRHPTPPALRLQDVRALALALLPVLCVCLLGLALMLASATRRKPKRD